MIKAAVLGSPISHSLSPRLHTAAYKFLNISGTYSSFEVSTGSLREFLEDKTDSWSGFSLTMPLKEEALSCVDFIDPLVRRIKSGNTLVNEDGIWKLYSTDVIGFKNAWKMHKAENPSSVVIIGSGATARAAAAAAVHGAAAAAAHAAGGGEWRPGGQGAAAAAAQPAPARLPPTRGAGRCGAVVVTPPRGLGRQSALVS